MKPCVKTFYDGISVTTKWGRNGILSKRMLIEIVVLLLIGTLSIVTFSIKFNVEWIRNLYCLKIKNSPTHNYFPISSLFYTTPLHYLLRSLRYLPKTDIHCVYVNFNEWFWAECRASDDNPIKPGWHSMQGQDGSVCLSHWRRLTPARLAPRARAELRLARETGINLGYPLDH